MIKNLKNSTALITGASRGLGVHIARALAHHGVNLALAARSRDPLETVAHELTGLGVKAVAFQADVSRSADRINLIENVEREFSSIDILINNAGVEFGSAFTVMPPLVWEQILATNLSAPVHLTQLVLPHMLARGQGHIVTLSSLAKLVRPYVGVYSATKAGLLAWSLSLRAELEGTGVSVSVVSPGYIRREGMFAERGGPKPPRMLGTAAPERVGEAVLRALQKNSVEEVVSERPTKLGSFLLALSPALFLRFVKLIGVVDFEKRLWQVE
jgi:short-subunit dehydrogenase